MSEYQITEYNQTAAALTELRSRYVRTYDVSTTAGMAEAKEARAAVRGYRVALEKTRVEIKAQALERTRLIDAEAKRITAELLAIEEPIDAAIKAEEQRKIEEKAAKERAEAARVETIKFRISYFAERVIAASNLDSKTITTILKDLKAAKLDEVDYQEMLPDAVCAKITAIEKLEAMLTERIFYEQQCERIKAEQEAEAARIKAERDELARLRAAEEERQAELEARRREEEAKRRKAETIAAITSIADVKEALATMEILPGEAIDRAYELGFNDGANAGLSVVHGLE